MSTEMAFTLPETLPDDLPALQELREAAIEALEEVGPTDGEAPSPEVLEEMRRLDEALTELDNAIAEVAAAEAERQEEAAAIRQRAFGTSDDDEDDADDDEGDDGDDAGDSDEFSGEAADDSDDSEASDSSDEAGADEPDDDESKDKAVTAGARRRTRFSGAARAAGRGPDVPKNKGPEFGYRLNGAARNYQGGYVDTLQLAKAMGDMATGRAPRRTISSDGQGGSYVTAQFGHLDRPIPADRMVSDEVSAEEVLTAATNERDLPGGSLVAAGGWCAPSETVYDFLGTENASDLLSLPEVGAARGGIRFPVEPDFSVIYDDFPGFHLTEAQTQAGEEKTSTEIPCSDFTELRLDVIGLSITNGILADKAWPEQTRKYIDEAMKAHQHRLSRHRIDAIVDGSTEVSIPAASVFGAAGAVLSSIELAVEGIRVRHRSPSGVTIEGAAPVWARGLIRADLAYRQGVLPAQVSDAQITAHFAERGVSLQFVVDWQDDVIGGASPATVWPSEIKVALWQAGTWYSVLAPVINLGLTYDAAMVKQNRRVELFTEDGIAVGKRREDSRVYRSPVAVDGAVGARAGGDGDSGN